MKYVGSGGVDWDVARETGGGALLENGKSYDVSEELAARLVLHNDWEAPSNKRKALRKAAEENRQRVAAQHSFDADKYEKVAQQQQSVQEERLSAEHEAFKAAKDEEAQQRALVAEEAGQEAAEAQAAEQGQASGRSQGGGA